MPRFRPVAFKSSCIDFVASFEKEFEAKFYLPHAGGRIEDNWKAAQFRFVVKEMFGPIRIIFGSIRWSWFRRARLKKEKGQEQSGPKAGFGRLGPAWPGRSTARPGPARKARVWARTARVFG